MKAKKEKKHHKKKKSKKRIYKQSPSPDRLENVTSEEDEKEFDRRMKKRRCSPSSSDDEFIRTPIQASSKIEINIPRVDDNVLRLSFPVSSGVQHRRKEWVPVCNNSSHSPKLKEETPFIKALESAKIPDKLQPPPIAPNLTMEKLFPKTDEVSSEALLKAIQASSEVQCGLILHNTPLLATGLPLTFKIQPAPPPVVKPEDLVFEFPKISKPPPKNVNELLVKRAKYSDFLVKDPNNTHTRKKIERIDEEMSAWASSKNLPGSFTGSTGVRVLSSDQLEPMSKRFHAWARKDQFREAPPVKSNFGKKLLEKMGWQPGHGLGRTENGPLEPLVLDVKSNRKGLASVEDKKISKRENIIIEGKNPVSCVMDICFRNGWKPQFECREMGPCHNRRFLWKANLNGVEYEPSVPASNKKAGKSQVCLVILQALGLIKPVDQ